MTGDQQEPTVPWTKVPKNVSILFSVGCVTRLPEKKVWLWGPPGAGSHGSSLSFLKVFRHESKVVFFMLF